VTAALLALSFLPATPLPDMTERDNAEIRRLVVGHWEVSWNGQNGWVRAEPDGSWYSCLRFAGDGDPGHMWAGRWRAAGGRLLVIERLSDDSAGLRWKFKLEDARHRLFVEPYQYGVTMKLLRRVRPRQAKLPTRRYRPGVVPEPVKAPRDVK
jgi:hypothetical protein